MNHLIFHPKLYAHPIRSFDVINPQTTGGGVTGGASYLAKKISSTQFSLHEYNSSQNGSQGYINPQTGGHKVHDSFWLDQRVSINSTNFPTKWFGSDHLPNSGLVKELVVGGGYEPGTNCMRLHISRGDGVADGMAYGVDTSVNQGDVVTVSFYYRTTVSTGVGKSVNWQTWFGGNSAPNVGFTIGPIYEWRRFTHTWTASVTYPFIQYWFPQGSGDKYHFDMADIQVEKKPYATFFTTGTRGTTVATGGGVIDLSGTSNNAEFLNVQYFDSQQGIFSFDGTDDQLIFAESQTLDLLNYTYAFWIKRIAGQSSSWLQFLQRSSSNRNPGMWFYINEINRIHFSIHLSNGNNTSTDPTGFFQNEWHYFTATVRYDGTNTYINGYTDGVLTSSTTLAGVSPITGTGVSWIGRQLMEIANFQVYNRSLSAEEILQNFNATRGRFRI